MIKKKFDITLLELLKKYAEELQVDWKILFAILACESGAEGYYTLTMKVRFETHIYASFYKQKIFGGVNKILPALKASWIKQHTEEQLDLMSTSFGMPQIMGWHYNMLGFTSVDQMFFFMEQSEENQIKVFADFCEVYREGAFVIALRKLQYKKIASMYNGAGYRKNNYDNRLIKFYQSAEKLILNVNEIDFNDTEFAYSFEYKPTVTDRLKDFLKSQFV